MWAARFTRPSPRKEGLPSGNPTSRLGWATARAAGRRPQASSTSLRSALSFDCAGRHARADRPARAARSRARPSVGVAAALAAHRIVRELDAFLPSHRREPVGAIADQRRAAMQARSTAAARGEDAGRRALACSGSRASRAPRWRPRRERRRRAPRCRCGRRSGSRGPRRRRRSRATGAIAWVSGPRQPAVRQPTTSAAAMTPEMAPDAPTVIDRAAAAEPPVGDAEQVAEGAGDQVHRRHARRAHRALDQRARLPERDHVEGEVEDARVQEARGDEGLLATLADRGRASSWRRARAPGAAEGPKATARGPRPRREDAHVQREEHARDRRLVEPPRRDEPAVVGRGRVRTGRGEGRGRELTGTGSLGRSGPPRQSAAAFLAAAGGLR